MDLEIREGRQWQIRLDGHMACVWVVAYEDPQIWGKLDADPSIYLHRIATHPDFRGRRWWATWSEWARQHAAEEGRTHVRLDTVGNNAALIRLYTSTASIFSERRTLRTSKGSPDITPTDLACASRRAQCTSRLKA